MVFFGAFFKFGKNLINLNCGSLILIMSSLKSKATIKFFLRDPTILVNVHSIHQLNYVILLCLNSELLNTINQLNERYQSVIVKIKDSHQANYLFLLTFVMRDCSSYSGHQLLYTSTRSTQSSLGTRFEISNFASLSQSII